MLEKKNCFWRKNTINISVIIELLVLKYVVIEQNNNSSKENMHNNILNKNKLKLCFVHFFLLIKIIEILQLTHTKLQKNI